MQKAGIQGHLCCAGASVRLLLDQVPFTRFMCVKPSQRMAIKQSESPARSPKRWSNCHLMMMKRMMKMTESFRMLMKAQARLAPDVVAPCLKYTRSTAIASQWKFSSPRTPPKGTLAGRNHHGCDCCVER